MSQYQTLKTQIQQNIKRNGEGAIRGDILQTQLLDMINALGAGYQFMGVATPTNPGTAQTPDYKCFYIATTPGTYTYLGRIVVADGEVALLKWDTTWTKVATGIATAAEVSQLGQETIKKSVGINLLNKRDVKRGYYLDAYGRENANATYSISGFIPVVSGEHYCRSLEMSQAFRFVNFYDSSLLHIGGSQIAYVNAFDVISGASYVRVSFYDDDYDYAQLTHSAIFLPYTDYTQIYGYPATNLAIDVVDAKNIKNQAVTKEKIQTGLLLENVIDEQGKNLIDPNNFIDGHWNQGHYDNPLYVYAKIDITHLVAGSTLSAIYSNGNPAFMRFVQFYNEKTFVSGSANVANAIIPDNCSSVYVTFEKQLIPDLNLSNVGLFNSENPSWEWFVEYTKAKWNKRPNDANALARLKDLERSSELYGKKWVACGDSFTHGDFTGGSEITTFQDEPYQGKNKVYPYYIGRRTGAIIVEDGVNGSTMAYIDGNRSEFSTPNGRYTQIPVDADIITLYFGINDAHQSVPIGSINDNVNTTFYGAWNIVLEWMINNRPDARIGIIITNGSSPEYTAVERAVAQKFGIPYLDLELDLSIPYILRQYERSVASNIRVLRNTQNSVDYPNNQHPNTKCHEHESYFIEKWIKTL